MKMLRARSVATAAAVIAALVGRTAWGAPVVMRVSHEKEPTSWVTTLMGEWARAVDADTKGAVHVKVYPNSTAYQPSQNFSAVRSGKIEAAMTEGNDFAEIVPSAGVLLRPYAFQNVQVMNRFLRSSIMQHIDRDAEARGVHAIGWIGIAFETAFGTGTGRLVYQPQDFSGVSMRSISSFLNPGFSALGAHSVQMEGLTRVLNAVTSGELGMLMTDVNSDLKFIGSVNTVSATPMERVFDILYVNRQWWASLSPKLQRQIEATTRRFEALSITRGMWATKGYEDALRSQGVAIRVTTSAEDAALAHALDPTFDAAFKRRLGPEASQLLDELTRLQ